MIIKKSLALLISIVCYFSVMALVGFLFKFDGHAVSALIALLIGLPFGNYVAKVITGVDLFKELYE